MKTSDLFLRCLEAEGVEYIFGLPGEENADLMISLLDSSIKFILTRHEQSAAFMADVYGRLTGEVGVCLSTLGPGATNLTTGIANANMDRSRVLAITGQTDSNMLHKESHQNMDVITMFKPITKWNQSIRNADNIPEIVRRAFKIAQEEKAGATHIELPQDVAKQESRIRPIEKPLEVLRSQPNKSLIEKAVRLILEAEKPLVLVGNGCIRGNASFHVRRFVEKTGICSMNTFMGKGVISDRWERHLQTIGIKAADHALIAMKEVDLVIAIGYDLVEYSPRFWNGDISKKIIHMDFTSAEVDTYYPPTVEIAADIELTINAILTELEKEKNENPNLKCFPCHDVPATFKRIKKELVERVLRYANDPSYPIKPEKLIVDVRRSLDDRDILISDVGAHKLWIAKTYYTYHPNTCLISNGFASMGFALPGAIAAQLAFPERKVVAMCGDGGFLMNVQEIETAVRLKLPVIIVIWCDREFGVIALKQIDEFGKKAFTEFNNPNFVKLASSFGAIGYAVKSTVEFPDILEQAKMSKDIPVIISVDIDYSRNKVLLDDNFLD
ncbi:MAG TPA: acetolactate synthase large subunit [Candidatus Nitrosopolaris rasttigaisensis]|nr:acetolactate synthase large subunit [Candidatus Nitrosopolaris rasttigaisensis]